MPSYQIPALLNQTHESSGHVGADHILKVFKKCFHRTLRDDQLRNTLWRILDKCPCRACFGDVREKGLYLTLSVLHCATSVLYVDYTPMPTFPGNAFALMVTCGRTMVTRVFWCTEHITSEETITILLERWYILCGEPT